MPSPRLANHQKFGTKLHRRNPQTSYFRLPCTETPPFLRRRRPFRRRRPVLPTTYRITWAAKRHHINPGHAQQIHQHITATRNYIVLRLSAAAAPFLRRRRPHWRCRPDLRATYPQPRSSTPKTFSGHAQRLHHSFAVADRTGAVAALSVYGKATALLNPNAIGSTIEVRSLLY